MNPMARKTEVTPARLMKMALSLEMTPRHPKLDPIFAAYNEGRADLWDMSIEDLEALRVLATHERTEARNHPNFSDKSSEQYAIYQYSREVLADIRMALAEKKGG